MFGCPEQLGRFAQGRSRRWRVKQRGGNRLHAEEGRVTRLNRILWSDRPISFSLTIVPPWGRKTFSRVPAHADTSSARAGGLPALKYAGLTPIQARFLSVRLRDP